MLAWPKWSIDLVRSPLYVRLDPIARRVTLIPVYLIDSGPALKRLEHHSLFLSVGFFRPHRPLQVPKPWFSEKVINKRNIQENP